MREGHQLKTSLRYFIRFQDDGCYDVDLDNFTGDPWKIVGEIAEDCPNWLNEFRKEFEENLREREYIR